MVFTHHHIQLYPPFLKQQFKTSNPKRGNLNTDVERIKRKEKQRRGRGEGGHARHAPERCDGREVVGGRHDGEGDGGEGELREAEPQPPRRPGHPGQVLHQHPPRLLRRIRRRRRRRRRHRVHRRPAREHLAGIWPRSRWVGEGLTWICSCSCWSLGGGGVRATAASSQTRAASACVRSRPRPSRERERVFFFFFFSFFILFYCSPFGRAKSGAVVSGEPRRHCGVGPARLHRPGSAF